MKKKDVYLKRPEDMEQMWPCACVKRDRRGNLKAIKLHSSFEKKCRTCGATRTQAGSR